VGDGDGEILVDVHVPGLLYMFVFWMVSLDQIGIKNSHHVTR
jgi:hypothetical protein